MPDFIGGNQVAEQSFRDSFLRVLDKLRQRNRRTTIATLIGGIRTKTFPENAIAGEVTRSIFVATVRLAEFSDQPVYRDALVVNQAHQLIAGDDADGTPVTVEITAAGYVTVIGRAGFTSPFKGVSYYNLSDINGNELDYVVGLRIKSIADLDTTLLADLNAWRLTQGRVEFTVADRYFEDPQIDCHGEDYYPGYIGASDGGRFQNTLAQLTCTTEVAQRDFYATAGTTGGGPVGGDWFYASIGDVVDFASIDAWYAQRISTVCS